MSEKMKAVLKYRFENAQKWANYTGRLTPEVIEEMKADNMILKKMAEEATKELLEEKKKKGKL